VDQGRFHNLLEAYLENRLTEADRAELNGALASSREPCRLFWEGVHQHALVGEVLAEARGFEIGAREKALAAGVRPRLMVRRLIIAAAVGVAAAIVVAVWALFRPGETSPPKPPADLGPAIARLEETEGEVYVVSNAGQVRAEAGQDLFAGHEIQTRGDDGFAVVRYPDATRLELGADSTLRLLAATDMPRKKVLLTQGVLVADVTRQPEDRSLVLKTPCADVLGPAARFLAAASSEMTRVELEAGKVQFAAANAGPPVELEAGSYAVASPGGPAPAPRPLPLRLMEEKGTLQVGKALQTGAFSPDGGLFAATAGDGAMKLWDVAARRMRTALPMPLPGAVAVAISADGRNLAAACPDKAAKLVRVFVWDAASGEQRAAFVGPPDVSALAFSPDGRRLAVGGADGKHGPDFVLWDLAANTQEAVPPQAVPQGNKWHGVASLAFSPDGGILALGGRDGVVRLIDMAGGRETALLRGHTDAVICAAFSPDGATLATGGKGKDPTVRMWDAATGRLRATLASPSGAVFSLCFSADGQTLAAGCDGGVGRLWDAIGFMEKATVQGHKKPVCRVAFAADGRTLQTAGRDGVIKFWDAAGEDQID
jgi:WD40 repeat protein/ferric-dicitrate binding protein FerR (iron transport regulator)